MGTYFPSTINMNSLRHIFPPSVLFLIIADNKTCVHSGDQHSGILPEQMDFLGREMNAAVFRKLPAAGCFHPCDNMRSGAIQVENRISPPHLGDFPYCRYAVDVRRFIYRNTGDMLRADAQHHLPAGISGF